MVLGCATLASSLFSSLCRGAKLIIAAASRAALMKFRSACLSLKKILLTVVHGHLSTFQHCHFFIERSCRKAGCSESGTRFQSPQQKPPAFGRFVPARGASCGSRPRFSCRWCRAGPKARLHRPAAGRASCPQECRIISYSEILAELIFAVLCL